LYQNFHFAFLDLSAAAPAAGSFPVACSETTKVTQKSFSYNSLHPGLVGPGCVKSELSQVLPLLEFNFEQPPELADHQLLIGSLAAHAYVGQEIHIRVAG
jgi:hypothetical protein